MEELNEALRDPLSAAAQAFMMKQIREKQVEDNYLLAQEHLPEAFGSVFMLYIDIEINGVPLKAFVDSGAQSTFISYSCAEKCSLTRIMDTRFRGIAQGVGRTEILGKIHLASLKIGKKFYPSSFTVLQDDKVEFLFGLDLLRRYQCCIDLHKHVLRIAGKNRTEKKRKEKKARRQDEKETRRERQEMHEGAKEGRKKEKKSEEKEERDVKGEEEEKMKER